MRQRSFSVNYELVSLAIGLGDEAIHFPKDDRIIFFLITELMSMAYILGLCHLSGFISAFYSIKTGFRVATTSWLQVTYFHPQNDGDALVFISVHILLTDIFYWYQVFSRVHATLLGLLSYLNANLL